MHIGRMLVIGAAGQVGGALVERLGPGRTIGTFWHTPLSHARQFDISDCADDPGLAAGLLAETGPDVVAITAGMTWVDGCEAQPETALRANCAGPGAVARAAVSAGARTVFYSTEYVFDGHDGPFGEAANVGPLSVYGSSKLAGEHTVLDADPQALVIRTTVVFGPEIQGKNFACQLVKRLRNGERMRVPNDQISTPTYNRDLADATVRLLEADATGVFHVTGLQRLDRAAFAAGLARLTGLDESLLDPVPTSEFDQQAARPLDAGLRIDKLLRTLPTFRPRELGEAVADWRARPRGVPWP